MRECLGRILKGDFLMKISREGILRETVKGNCEGDF